MFMIPGRMVGHAMPTLAYGYISTLTLSPRIGLRQEEQMLKLGRGENQGLKSLV